MKNKFAVLFSFAFCLTFFYPGAMFSLEPVNSGDILLDSATLANRKTALRCLELAKDYASKKDWNSVVSQASLGLAYDENISDLWYVYAIAENALGETKSKVLDLVTKSLTKGQWVDYNRDGARILYADILCDTGRFSEVQGVLDSKPMLYSADAEFIRTKSFYRMKDEKSLSDARMKIDTARKIYPNDVRFPLLFFKYENPDDENETVRKIAQSFISRVSLYTNLSSGNQIELEIYASLFARGEDKIRMLKSFSAKGYEHPLYAAAALKANLIDEEAAFDYFTSFADGSIEYKMLEDFVSLIRSEPVKELANTYFTAYSGVILSDTDGDGIDNMYVKYYRGRPDTVVYDKNQDGVKDWRIVCDFGVPINAQITSNNLFVKWEPYPYLNEVVFEGEENKSVLTFNMVQETLNWTPVELDVDKNIKNYTGSEFFYPNLIADSRDINDEMLIGAASSYEIPTKERSDAKIKFTILDGQAQTAQYFQNSKMYAQAEFLNGFPSMRIVDADDDGVFETTEFYGFDKDGTMEVHTMEEERAVMTNLFGLPATGAGFYLRLIQIDRNADTVPDFTEEYLLHNGKISSWDTDSDGLWDIRYVRYSQETDADGNKEPLVEDSLFYETAKRNLVTVTSIDGIPEKVKENDVELSITKDSKYDFYWIGKEGRSDFAKKAIDLLNQNTSQGVSITVADGDTCMMCVRIAEFYFGRVVQNQNLEEVQKK